MRLGGVVRFLLYEFEEEGNLGTLGKELRLWVRWGGLGRLEEGR